MAGNKKKHLPSELENLSIPELEALLQQDFTATGGGAPDVDYIRSIIEVIQNREKLEQGYLPVDTEKAWNDFQAYRKGWEHDIPSPYFSDEENTVENAAPLQPSRRGSRHFRAVLIAAAVIAVLVIMMTVPVFSHTNLFQMLGQWSSEQFHFVPSDSAVQTSYDSSDFPLNEDYKTLEEALYAYGIDEQLPPSTLPDGFVQAELYVDNFPSSRTEFAASYTNGTDQIIISLLYYYNGILNDSEDTWIEKDHRPVTSELIDGVQFYFFNNLEQEVVVWCQEPILCTISTTLSRNELKNMVDSIYS